MKSADEAGSLWWSLSGIVETSATECCRERPNYLVRRIDSSTVHFVFRGWIVGSVQNAS